MPTDAWGFRADVIIDPASTIKRMNTGQLDEVAINRTSEFVRRRIEALYMTDVQSAWDTLLDYYNDINRNFADLVSRTYPTPEKQNKHVKGCIEKGIYLHIPPFLDQMTPLDIDLLINKWGLNEGPVTYTLRDRQGGEVGTFTTEDPVMIGEKYMYLLGKIPDPTSAGVARISHFGTAIKPSAGDKMRHPLTYTALKHGEDDQRLKSMDIPAEVDMRFLGLQANSMKGVETAIATLLTSPHPTNIDKIDISDDELIRTNSPVTLFHHMMATMGIESRFTKTDKGIPPELLLSYLEDDSEDDLEAGGDQDDD